MSPATENRKHLVLGMAIGYTAKQLKPFVFSLKETGYDGETVFIISQAETDPDSIEALRSWGITLVPYEAWRFMPTCIHVTRYIKYYEFLLDGYYDYILLTDTKDVIFQKDPFCIDKSQELYFFAEDPGITIGTCLSNAQLIKSAFGTEMLAALYHKRVSCSGTTMGSYQGIIKYLMAMVEIIGIANPASLKVIGVDQAFHHVIIYDKIIKNYCLMDNQKHINTMCRVPQDGVSLADDGTIFNADGTVSPIVHQYDYSPHEKICAAVLKKYYH